MGRLNTENHQYSTTDTAQASYLIVKGFTIASIDYSAPRFVFYFIGPPERLQEHAQHYIAGTALVDPATFTRVNRKLTRILKNRLQWGDE